MSILRETPTGSKPTTGPTMPFGVHKGKPLDDLPDDYLLWPGCLDDLRQPLLSHVLREMSRRLADRPAPSRDEVPS